MRLAPTVLAASLAATFTLAASRPARACSYPDGVYERAPLPADGAIGVPTNVRVIVSYRRSFSPVPETVALRVHGGATVAATSRRVALPFLENQIVTPAAALLPDTTYEITDRVLLEDECDLGIEDCVGEPRVIATFTTGAGLDKAPPSVDSASVISRYFAFEANSSCGEGSSIEHTPALAGARDDSGVVLYNYYTSSGTLVAGPLPLLSVGHACGRDDAGNYALQLDSDTFTVRAVDIAGNEEAAGHTLTGDSCDELDGGGCQASRGGGGLLFAVGAVVALGLRRRR